MQHRTNSENTTTYRQRSFFRDIVLSLQPLFFPQGHRSFPTTIVLSPQPSLFPFCPQPVILSPSIVLSIRDQRVPALFFPLLHLFWVKVGKPERMGKNEEVDNWELVENWIAGTTLVCWLMRGPRCHQDASMLAMKPQALCLSGSPWQ